MQKEKFKTLPFRSPLWKKSKHRTNKHNILTNYQKIKLVKHFKIPPYKTYHLNYAHAERKVQNSPLSKPTMEEKQTPH